MIRAQRPALREYLALLDRVPEVFRRSWDAIAIYDIEGRLMAGNAAARKLIGQELATTVQGQHFNSHMSLDVARRAARQFAECVTSGKVMEGDSTFREADGTPIPVRVKLVPARLDGVIVGVIGFARDTRALRSVESQFMRSEQQFRSLFEHHPDALAIHDLEARYVRVNAALTKMTGYSPEELIGRTPEVLTGTAYTDLDRILAGISRGETVDFERSIVTKGGDRITLSGILVPLLVDGELRGYCGISRDVTEERRRERESARAAKRIGDLYRIAAASMPAEDKVISALDLARVELEASWAYVGRVADGAIELTHVSGDSDRAAVGCKVPLEQSMARHVMDANDAFVVDDVARAPFRSMLGDEQAGWRSFIGVPLVVEGERYGTIGFMTRTHHLRLSPTDRDYARAIAALISSAVQQSLREKRLDTLAFHDALTGLPNRALLQDRLERTLLAARRNKRSFAVHYVDIDHFKSINDTHGHHVGDGVLVAVAHWLQSMLRDSDTVARIGGDEFVVLQPEIASMAAAEEVAAKLVTIHDRPLRVGGLDIEVRLSVGVAVYPADGAKAVDMLRAADATLYDVKNNGRDGYAIGMVAP
jgi:diguanylate cyclase (GGDEF)-like protein/PAS domain S-box-containing protein